MDDHHGSTDLAALDDRLAAIDTELNRLSDRVVELRSERSALLRRQTVLAHRAAAERAAEQAAAQRPTAIEAATPAPQLLPDAGATERAAAAVGGGEMEPHRPERGTRPPTAPRPEPEPGRPEASTASIQAILLVLGGLLLGVAAITFTAVAWTTFGPAGRAAILGTVTVIFLVVPVLLARRGLAATAETISAVALLLVILDGYAIWALGLFGVDRLLHGFAYAGLVFLAAGLAGAAYRAVTGLVVPRFAALLAAQPVMPLLAAGAAASGGSGDGDRGLPTLGTDEAALALAGVAILAAAVAAQNLIAVIRLDPTRVARPERPDAPLRALGWLLHAVALTVAWLSAWTGTLTAENPVPSLVAGAALLATAAVGLGAGIVSRRSWLRQLSAGAATLTAVAAVSVPVMLGPIDVWVVPLAAATAVSAFAVRALPPAWRRGPAVADALVATVLGLAAGVVCLLIGVRTIAVAWENGPHGYPELPTNEGSLGWRLPLTVVLLTVIGAALAGRRGRHHVGVGGTVLTVLAAPVSFGMPWWAVPAVSAAAALALGLSTLAPGREAAGVAERAYLRAVAAGVLALHAVGAALGDVRSAAIALAVLMAGGTVLAAAGSRLDARHNRNIAEVAAGLVLTALPMTVIAWAGIAGWSDQTVRAAGLVGAAGAVAIGAALALVRGAPRPVVRAGAAVGVVITVLAGQWADDARLIDVVVIALLFVATGLVVPVRAATGDRWVLMAHPAAAVVALIATLARLASLVLPGSGMVAAALLAAAVAGVATAVPAIWRPGLRSGALAVAGAVGAVGAAVAAAAAGAAVLVPLSGLWRADLDVWPESAAGAAWYGWQVPAALTLIAVTAAVAAPGRYRYSAALAAAVAAVGAAPAALALPWWTPMVFSGVAGAALAVAAVRLRDARESAPIAVAGALLGVHAAAASLVRPGSTALVLTATVGICLLVAALGYGSPRGPYAVRLADAALGGALAAVPGAAAASAAALAVRPGFVVALGLTTASLALGIASLLGLARHVEAPAFGAAFGAVLTAGVVFFVDGTTQFDRLAAAVLLIGAGARLRRRRRERTGAAGATLALIAELSQLVALVLPGAPLVSTALVVAAVALAVRRLLPPDWRPGPTGGVAVAGVAVGAVAGLATLADAAYVLELTGLSRPAGVELLGAQPAVAVLILAGTALLFADRRREVPFGPGLDLALGAVAVAAVHAPVGLGLQWWTPAVVAGAVAAGLGVLAGYLPARRTGLLAGALAGGLALYAVGAGFADDYHAPVLGGLIAVALVVAAVAARAVGPAAPVVGGAAAGAAVGALPATVAATLDGLRLDVLRTYPLLGAAALALGVAAALRRVHPPYLPYAVRALPFVVITALALLPGEIPAEYAGVCAVVGVLGGLLLLPERAAATAVVAAAAGAPAVIAAVKTLPVIAVVLLSPYTWLAEPWTGEPVNSADGLTPFHVDWSDAPGPVAIALLAVAMAAATLARDRRWVLPAVLPGVAAIVVVVPITLAAPWPVGPAATLLVGVATGLWAARTGWPAAKPHRATVVTATLVCVLAGGAGLAATVATAPTTVAGLAVAVIAGSAAGVLGRRTGARVTGWLVASFATVALATVLAELGRTRLAVGPFAAAVVLLAVAAVLSARRSHPAEIVAVEVVSYGAVVSALAATSQPRHTAAILVGYGAVLGLSALRRGRSGLAAVAGGCELVAWWMLLSAADVGLIEAYTLPFALLALAGGLVGQRRRPALRSWIAYGPALAAAFLPSLALVLVEPGQPLRRLLLGMGAIAMVVLGGARQRQAPVVVGAAVLVLVTLNELIVLWDQGLRWIPLAIGGLLLVSIGGTYERRTRDVRRLRRTVSQMR